MALPLTWDDAVASLDQSLKTWLKRDGTDLPVCVLVGPPHSGYTDILENWSELLIGNALSKLKNIGIHCRVEPRQSTILLR